jgi:transposase-like protein
MNKCPFCNSKNTATSIGRIRGEYRTYCLDCKKEILVKSRIAEIFEDLERLKE